MEAKKEKSRGKSAISKKLTAENVLIETASEKQSSKLEEILQKKASREKAIKKTCDSVQEIKAAATEKLKFLTEVRNENQHISLEINCEDQWYQGVIKRLIDAYNKLKIVKKSTNMINDTIASNKITQESFQQLQEKLLEMISSVKQEAQSKYKQLLDDESLLIKKIGNEKQDVIEFEHQAELENKNLTDKINSMTLNDIEIKLNNFNKISKENDEKTKHVVFEKQSFSSLLEAVCLNGSLLIETIQNKKKEFNMEMQHLNESFDRNKEILDELERDIAIIKEKLNHITEILNDTNIYKSKLNEKLLNVEKIRVCFQKETNDIKQKHELEAKEFEENMSALTKKIQEYENQIIEMKNDNLKLNDNHNGIINDIIIIETDCNKLDNILKELNDEYTKLKIIFNTTQTTLEDTIEKLKNEIRESNLKIILDSEILKLKDKEIIDLKIQLENENQIAEKVSNEAIAKERALNLRIDELRATKERVITELEEIKVRMTDVMQTNEVELQRVEANSERKLAQILEQLAIFEKEKERVYKANNEKRKQDINKLQEKNTATKLQLSKLESMKLNLQNEIDMCFKEIEKIREENEIVLKQNEEIELRYKKELELKQEKERELQQKPIELELKKTTELELKKEAKLELKKISKRELKKKSKLELKKIEDSEFKQKQELELKQKQELELEEKQELVFVQNEDLNLDHLHDFDSQSLNFELMEQEQFKYLEGYEREYTDLEMNMLSVKTQPTTKKITNHQEELPNLSIPVSKYSSTSFSDSSICSLENTSLKRKINQKRPSVEKKKKVVELSIDNIFNTLRDTPGPTLAPITGTSQPAPIPALAEKVKRKSKAKVSSLRPRKS